MPVIFEYIDFKKYLQEYYTWKKSQDAAFSHSYICHRLGQANSKSYFNNILKGRATISATFVDRFIELLELKPDEAKYFRALVSYNQTSSPHEKEFFFDQLVRLNSTPHAVVDKSAYEYYKEWHHTALRALLDIIDFKDDYKTLASTLYQPITLKQARDSIGLLKRTGMIERNGNGFWKPTNKVVVSGNYIKDALVKQFQIKCLEHGKSVLASEKDLGHRKRNRHGNDLQPGQYAGRGRGCAVLCVNGFDAHDCVSDNNRRERPILHQGLDQGDV